MNQDNPHAKGVDINADWIAEDEAKQNNTCSDFVPNFTLGGACNSIRPIIQGLRIRVSDMHVFDQDDNFLGIGVIKESHNKELSLKIMQEPFDRQGLAITNPEE